MLQNIKIQEKHENLISIFPKCSRNTLTNIGEEVTPKRSPKRRGPAKKYVPETTEVTPTKKPRKKAVPRKGAKATTQTTIMPTATTSTVIAVPEILTPSTSPLENLG